MDNNSDYAGHQIKELVTDEEIITYQHHPATHTTFENVQLFGEMFSDDIMKNSMTFLCTKKGSKTYFIRLHVMEGKEREFELGMIFLFAARLGCLKGSDPLMTEEELKGHFCDLEGFIRNTTKHKKTKKALIEEIRRICNSNIDFHENSSRSSTVEQSPT